MSKFIKWFFLFFLIVFPVCVFVFLKAFGENKFVIPIFYEDGFTESRVGCGDEKGQHFVTSLNSYIDSLNLDDSQVVIYNLGDVSAENLLAKSNNLLSVNDKMKHWQGVSIIGYNSNSVGFISFINCSLNLEVTLNNDGYLNNKLLVLVDSGKRIRGYYDVLDREEVDRLIIEINILLQE